MYSMLTDDEKQRYDRQIILPGWGMDGQKRVEETTVFVAGAGGLGSVVAYYLAAAGVGCLRICDAGTVELSNLNRQIIHTSGDVGRKKVDSAVESVSALNPHVELIPLYDTIDTKSVGTLIGEASIIVDCLDNFATRYVLNEYSIENRIPFVHAGVYGLTGQVTFIHPPETPCLYCLFSEYMSAEKVFPIVGATAGIIGAIEALEVLKWIVGGYSLLKGRLLVFEGDLASFDEVKVERNPECPVCGLTS